MVIFTHLTKPMSESSEGKLQNFSVDQAAGAVVLVLGAVGGLLLVVWQSACHCKINLCYMFQCERRPPSEEKMKTLKGIRDERRQQAADETQTARTPRGPLDTPRLEITESQGNA